MKLISIQCICYVALILMSMIQVCKAEKPEPPDILLFMFFGIGVGIVIMQCLNKLGDPVPFTVVVFVVGILLSLANKESTGLLGSSIHMWVDIDADLLLYVFLPPLVYGEAMGLNWYHAKVAFPQSLVLAGPGVVVGAVLMGCFAKGIFPDWSWYLALTFGSISAATDTVAVVSLLKSAGASPKLTMIIVGESLINDGAAMLLFDIFNNLLNGESYSAGSLIAEILASSIGSVLVGIVFGLMTVRWLRTANRPVSEIDVLVQSAITIVSAYLTFYFAQKVLHISGVLACVTAGAMVAWRGTPVILSQETMHNVWGMAEWVLNTLIFMLAGLIIGNRVSHFVQPVDWFYLVVLYVMMMLIRFFVIFLSWPILSNTGHKCSWQDAVFMGWGGLRGALGMALALIVYRGAPPELEHQTSSLFFYVGGMAAITIIVNATTSNFVLTKLDLVGVESAEKRMVIASIHKKLRKDMRAALAELASEFRFSETEVEEVRQSVSLLSGVSMEDINQDVAELRRQRERKAEEKERRQSFYGSMPGQLPRRDSSTSVDLAARVGGNTRSGTVTNPLHTSFGLELPGTDHTFHGLPSPTGHRSPSLHSQDRRPSSPQNPIHRDKRHSYSSLQELSAISEDGDEDGIELTNKVERMEAGRRSSSPALGPSPSASPGPGTIYSHTHDDNRGVLRRSLSMAARNPQHTPSPQLLAYVRSTFLSMVRVRYWNDIERGKIPRKSKAGKFLLYSVEVGIDEAHLHADVGMRDWTCIEYKLDHYPIEMRLLQYWEENTPNHWLFQAPSDYLNIRECRREERMVYILTSFIAAHESAERKIHGFLQVEGEEDFLNLQSCEELKVIAESKLAVKMARRRLADMNPDTVAAIRTKQAGALILTKQAEEVKDMVHEGLITQKDAEEIIHVINSDMQGINQKRNLMYMQYGATFSHRRKNMRKIEGRLSSDMFDL